MIGFSYSSNLMDSGSNLEHSVSPPSEYIERAESPNERHRPTGGDSRPDSASNARYDPDSSVIVISDSSPYSMSSSTSSPILISSSPSNPILISSSNDEDSETSSLILVESEERSLSTGLPESGQEGRQMTPIIIDDSDSGSSFNLDEVLLLTEADPHQTTGLTTTQIDNLPLRCFAENDSNEVCSICITEYTTGNMLRILPCSHEYHYACIDRWLAEHSNCPICRGPVVDPPEAGNSM